MARLIISVAEAAAILLVFGTTVAGALLGSNVQGDSGAIWGAAFGFLLAVFVTAFFFALVQIEKNTRRTVQLLEGRP